MATNNINTTHQTLDFTKINFNPPKEQKSKYSQKIFMNDFNKPRKRGGEARKLILKIPRLYAFGIQSFRDDEDKFGLSLQFPMDAYGYRTNETDKALSKLLEFENHVLDYMTRMSPHFFGSTLSKDKIKSMFRPFVTYPKQKNDTDCIDYETPPYIRPRLQYYTKTKNFQGASMMKRIKFYINLLVKRLLCLW